MLAQAAAATGPADRDSTASVIERLYIGIRNADVPAIMDCYATDAHFKDIAFDVKGKQDIQNMWRYVCNGRPHVVDFGIISADSRTGTGWWRAKYAFGKTDTDPGRPVDNKLTSQFVFSDNVIVDHHDRCNVVKWAFMALPFPKNIVAAVSRRARERVADQRLKEFLSKHPQR